MVCCFFGHRNTPCTIELKLKNVLTDIIINKNVDTFLVGNQGKFDTLVVSVLNKLKQKFPFIKYYIVLAYMPANQEFGDDTIYPDGLEKVPRRFAISYRNKWMIKQSDFVVCYVEHSTGGAAYFTEYAARCRREVINLAGSFNLLSLTVAIIPYFRYNSTVSTDQIL